MHKLLFCLSIFINLSAFAHEGHGLSGSHGHATDALGFVVTALVVVAMIWAGRK